MNHALLGFQKPCRRQRHAGVAWKCVFPPPVGRADPTFGASRLDVKQQRRSQSKTEAVPHEAVSGDRVQGIAVTCVDVVWVQEADGLRGELPVEDPTFVVWDVLPVLVNEREVAANGDALERGVGLRGFFEDGEGVTDGAGLDEVVAEVVVDVEADLVDTVAGLGDSEVLVLGVAVSGDLLGDDVEVGDGSGAFVGSASLVGSAFFVDFAFSVGSALEELSSLAVVPSSSELTATASDCGDNDDDDNELPRRSEACDAETSSSCRPRATRSPPRGSSGTAGPAAEVWSVQAAVPVAQLGRIVVVWIPAGDCVAHLEPPS